MNVEPPPDLSAVTEGPSTLRCPSCGAPAAPDAGRCLYCQSRLATIGCPVCMALLFQGAAFCPSCGAARSRTEEAQPHATKCPACRGDMHWIRVGDVDLLECASCDGTWIEAAAFDRLCTQREQQAAIAHKAMELKEPGGSAPHGGDSRPLSPLPSVRKNDEPPELRPALRDHRRCVQRAWDVSGSRRAASGREVHPRRGIQPHAPGRAGAAEGRNPPPARAGAASEPVTRRTKLTGELIDYLLRSYTSCLLFRDTQRLPVRPREVFREQHDLPDVGRVV